MELVTEVNIFYGFAILLFFVIVYTTFYYIRTAYKECKEQVAEIDKKYIRRSEIINDVSYLIELRGRLGIFDMEESREMMLVILNKEVGGVIEPMVWKYPTFEQISKASNPYRTMT